MATSLHVKSILNRRLLFIEQETIDTKGNALTCALKGRHDPCIAVRGSVVAESMAALVIADMMLLNLGSRMEHLHAIYP